MMEPTLVKLELGAGPSPAGAGELVLVTDATCQIVFVTLGGQCALASFIRCTQCLYGYPNDEAQVGHPLYADWVDGFYEVIGSTWEERLAEQNRVAFPETRSDYRQRHFLAVFRESMAEILADDVQVHVFEEPFEKVALRALGIAIKTEGPTLIPRSWVIGGPSTSPRA